MHELAVTQSMLDLVLSEAKRAGAAKVERINLVIGQMSGVVGESVEFYFRLLSEGTIADGAALCFTNTQTQARCRDCGTIFAVEESQWLCPGCRSVSLEITGGNELAVESIEVE